MDKRNQCRRLAAIKESMSEITGIFHYFHEKIRQTHFFAYNSDMKEYCTFMVMLALFGLVFAACFQGVLLAVGYKTIIQVWAKEIFFMFLAVLLVVWERSIS